MSDRAGVKGGWTIKKSTQKWLGVGLVIAVLFFAGALAIFLLTNEAIDEDPKLGPEGAVEYPIHASVALNLDRFKKAEVEDPRVVLQVRTNQF